MKLEKTCIAIAVASTTVSLSGCSTASALSGLLGSKPDVTAQIGAENTKQLAGVTAKSDDKREVKVENSNIGKIDSSLKKSMEVSTIQANTVNAESITAHKTGELVRCCCLVDSRFYHAVDDLFFLP
ncbi:spanin [Shigella phage vB_SsoS_008]|nr:spanin [Shigella phage vB_SsoS_008]